MIYKYILTALFVSFLWGLSPILNKFLLGKFNYISLFVFSSVVYFIAMLMFAYYNYDIVQTDLQKINADNLFFIVGTVVITGFLANVLYLYVLKDHESSLISALVFSSPLFTLLIARTFMKEKLNYFGIIGILLIVSGTICIAFNDSTYKVENFFSYL
jgi:drug/metabolite transporter (DMT)-like permease